MITRQLDFFKGARVQPNNIVSVQGHPEGTKAAQRHSIGPSSRAMKVVQHEGRASSALDASLHSLPHTCRGAHVYTYTYMQCMHTYTYTLIISLSLSDSLWINIWGNGLKGIKADISLPRTRDILVYSSPVAVRLPHSAEPAVFPVQSFAIGTHTGCYPRLLRWWLCGWEDVGFSEIYVPEWLWRSSAFFWPKIW